MSIEQSFALAPNAIFWSLQGEGHLRGFQMAFLRLAGCSVGCVQCDTNYSVDQKVPGKDILLKLAEVRPEGDRDRWVWVTGGEPSDQDLRSLIGLLKAGGWSGGCSFIWVQAHYSSRGLALDFTSLN